MDSSKNNPSRVSSTALDDVMPLIREQLQMGCDVTFGPRGTSMRPLIRQGRDSVTLSPIKHKLKKYDLPLYQRANGQYVLHRIVKVHKDGTYTCIGDNQYAYEHGVDDSQMIAYATAVIRDGKKIKCSCAAYRIYCRVWHISRVPRHYFRAIVDKIKTVLDKK